MQFPSWASMLEFYTVGHKIELQLSQISLLFTVLNMLQVIIIMFWGRTYHLNTDIALPCLLT